MAIKHIFFPESNEMCLFSHYSFFQTKNIYFESNTWFIC